MFKKLTYEFVKEQFEKEGYELLSEEYKNCEQKLNYICPNRHQHSIMWNMWQQKKRCPYCNGRPIITIDIVRESMAKENYALLTKKYKNNKQKLYYICPKGHKHSTKWYNWKTGYRCPHCSGKAKPTIEFIKIEFAKEGYELLTTEYVNSKQKLDYICFDGHKHNVSWAEWNGYNRRCPECIGIISKGEIEVKSFVKSLGVKVLANVRNQIFNPETGYGLELDIFMSTLNKAVEYNGEYWHKDKTKDLLKQELCKSKMIDLLIIWENEWKTEKNVCKDKIKEFIFN